MNPTRRRHQMQHWRAHRPWEEVDEGYHSRQTYKQVRKVHCHEQKISVSPHMRRRWLIGRFSSGTSFTVRLPRLSSLAIRFGWIYEKGEENRYKVCEGGEVQRTEVVASVDVFEAGVLGWYL